MSSPNIELHFKSSAEPGGRRHKRVQFYKRNSEKPNTQEEDREVIPDLWAYRHKSNQPLIFVTPDVQPMDFFAKWLKWQQPEFLDKIARRLDVTVEQVLSDENVLTATFTLHATKIFRRLGGTIGKDKDNAKKANLEDGFSFRLTSRDVRLLDDARYAIRPTARRGHSESPIKVAVVSEPPAMGGGDDGTTVYPSTEPPIDVKPAALVESPGVVASEPTGPAEDDNDGADDLDDMTDDTVGPGESATAGDGNSAKDVSESWADFREWTVDKRPPRTRRGSGRGGPPEDEVIRREKGRWGEEYAWRVLAKWFSKKYPSAIPDGHDDLLTLTEGGEEKVCIRWMNGTREQYGPYDICIEEKGAAKRYVEVKSTSCNDESDGFEVTAAQWDCATDHGENFLIVRVYRVGTRKASASVLRDPVAWFEKKGLDLSPSRFSIKLRKPPSQISP